jgi:hypothetical protein
LHDVEVPTAQQRTTGEVSVFGEVPGGSCAQQGRHNGVRRIDAFAHYCRSRSDTADADRETDADLPGRRDPTGVEELEAPAVGSDERQRGGVEATRAISVARNDPQAGSLRR